MTYEQHADPCPKKRLSSFLLFLRFGSLCVNSFVLLLFLLFLVFLLLRFLRLGVHIGVRLLKVLLVLPPTRWLQTVWMDIDF